MFADMNKHLARSLRAFDCHGTAPTSAVLVPLHRCTIAEPAAVLELYFPRVKFHAKDAVAAYYRELLRCHLIEFGFERDSIHLMLGDVALVCVWRASSRKRKKTRRWQRPVRVCVCVCPYLQFNSSYFAYLGVMR